ncbi:hypothetical protein DFP73DRAFT_489685 [Morchella snyderi]|nr:hypothetical protein DFP73DRAFT_489685 [Morchella snyderi]
MLVWAATKRVPRDVIRHHNTLPSSGPGSLLSSRLSPSPLGGDSQSRRPLPNSRALKTLNAIVQGRPQSIRGYSTATPPFAAPHAEAYAPNRPLNSRSNNRLTHGIQPIDTNKVIILGTPKEPTDVDFQTRVKDKNEYIALFSVCLEGGYITRASKILTSMSLILPKDAPILLNAHNLFLKALLERSNKSEDLKVFFMWYDKMRTEYKIPGDSNTFALILKASLKYEPQAGQAYINKYVQQWKATGNSIGDVLVDPVLSDEEVIKIAKIAFLRVSELHESHRHLFETTPQRDLPEIKSVSSRGHGLAAIQQSIRSLVDPKYMPESFSVSGQENLALQVERQRLLEEDAWESAQDRWKKDHETMRARGVLAVSSSLNSLLWEWHQSFVPLINEELSKVRTAELEPRAMGAHDRCLYGPFLRMLPPEKVAAIVMVELLKVHNSSAGALKTSKAVMHVGNMLEAEYLAQEIQKKENKEIFANLRNKENLGEIFNNDKILWAKLIKEARETVPQEARETLLPEWPVKIKAKLGAVLLTMLLHCAKAPVRRINQEGESVELAIPAFYHTYKYIKGKKLGLITLDSTLLKRLGTEDLRQGFLGRNLPMVVPPREWKSWERGGYYYTQSKAVRTKGAREQLEYVKIASERGDLNEIFASLDVLGKTAWRINKKVFDVVIEVWNSEKEFGDIPPAAQELVLPPEPATSLDPSVRYEWLQAVRTMQVDAVNNHSKRCSVNFKVEIARAFLHDKFYFPHNVDFRGRAYPIPPNLNHIGDDLSRGLLQFDIGKPLGENGHKWLKIHLANLCGFDKASFEERAAYADEHIEDIIDSATDPLGGKRWWLEAEDPWQCLATCFTLKEIHECEDPSQYICNIPVAQDGTCNGLQHYAALGGDMMGAAQVNLIPAERPSDVYTGVSQLVTAAVKRDAESGNEMAQILHDKISRKVVKQTVMTNVYGVTFMGAKEQIYSQLKDLPSLAEYKTGSKYSLSQMALYLTHKVFNSISTMFYGASQIQEWLGSCAKRISLSVSPHQVDQSILNENTRTLNRTKGRTKKDEDGDAELPPGRKKKEIHFMTSVVWTTPLRLPVVQPYRLDKVQLVITNLQNIYITDPSVIDEINSRKQMMAFPPNFIHSLDATHMLMSAKRCHDANLTFASVHDSFWTHPSDVDTLNRILREAFIDLHSSEVMSNLKAEFEVRYKGHMYLAILDATHPIAAAVKALRDTYSKDVLKRKSARGLTLLEDLHWERKRALLLESENEEERKMGEEMITPSILVERMGGLGSLGEETPEEAEPEHPEGEDYDLELHPLHPVLADSETAVDETMSPNLAGDEEPEEDILAPKKTKEEKASKPKSQVTRIWMPLKFPELPPKGEFKVEDLKRSKYFFS